MSYQDLFQAFASKKVLIIGDVMIDAYLFGSVDRISPEAPVPVVSLNKRENRLGGAANVALNVRALDATPILCSVVGSDAKGEEFKQLLRQSKISDEGIVVSTERKTTVKYRVIGNQMQMLRIDEESTHPLDGQETSLLLDKISGIIAKESIDVIVFQDYDKGCMTESLIEKITALANARHIPTCVDPKKRNFLSYKHVTLFKPNLKELKEGLSLQEDLKDLKNLEKALAVFQQQQDVKMAFTTLSADGVCIRYDDCFDHFPAHVRNIADVSGAGDTVISVAALCLACRLSPPEIAKISNLAGGIVCEYVGVVPIPKDIFFQEITNVFGL